MGRPKKDETDRKLALLQTIKERKSILFGQFSSDVDKLKIERAWEDSLVHAKSLTLVADKCDVSHLRKLFSQWKSRTLEKKDNAKKTGTGGGKSCKLNEVDLIILDIVGKESPVVEGLQVGESGNFFTANEADVSPDALIIEEDDTHEIHVTATDDPPVKTTSVSDPSNCQPYTIQTKKRKLNPATEKDVLLEAKWKAQTEYLKQQTYNLMLQNYKLEIELGLPHSSEHTSSLKPL